MSGRWILHKDGQIPRHAAEHFVTVYFLRLPNIQVGFSMTLIQRVK
jgi:hypothetical protein